MIRWVALACLLLVGVLSEPLTWGFALSRHKLTPLAIPSSGHFPDELQGRTWNLEAQGGQSYVFTSGPYVLKFFKDQPRPWLPLASYRAQKNKKLHRTLSGYSLIHERCPELSGIICLHTQNASPIPATLVDRLGISHTADLNSYLFVLQHRAEALVPPSTPEGRQHLLESATQLMQTLALHHLKDHDPRLHLNLGRLKEGLIVIDPGRIALCDAPPSELPNKFMEFAKSDG
jgi:hypothetical protein